MPNKELKDDLIQRACDGDESARVWLQEEHILPPNLTTPSRTIEFLHSSMMNEPVEVEFMLVDKVWRAINPNGDFGSTTFAQDEIYSPVYWS